MLTWQARTHLLLLHAALVLGLLTAPAHAATFVVTNNADAGAGTLRQAIFDANTSGGGQIVFSNITGVITLTSGVLTVSNNIVIAGPGPGVLAVSGNDNSRVFRHRAGATSAFSGITITLGRWSGSAEGSPAIGGGVLNSGHLTLSNCVISNNRFIPFYGGGGLGNEGMLILEKCVVTNNLAGPFAGTSPGWGGGIYNVGTLRLNQSLVAGNSALASPIIFPQSSPSPARGGGIYNGGTMLCSSSTIEGNSCGPGSPSDGIGGDGGSGGGLYNAGSASIEASTISYNNCGAGNSGGGNPIGSPGYPGGKGGSGGGIWNGGQLFVTNCTIYGNASGRGGNGGGRATLDPYVSGNGGNGGDGGGVFSENAFLMSSCTVSGNLTGAGGNSGFALTPGAPGQPGRGGGGWAQNSTWYLKNSIVASNMAAGGGPDVGGTASSLGYNLLGLSNGNSGFTSIGDLQNTNALLGPLANNGGPTLTCALLPDSPARDAGHDIWTSTDQRGFARSSGGQVDIGAYELQVPSGPIVLSGLRTNEAGGFQFFFTNTPGARFRVVSSTNVATPGTNWPVIHNFIDSPTGHFEYTDSQATNTPVRFFRVVWP